MRQTIRCGTLALLTGLAGCVVAPPPPSPQIPLVAIPGPTKTQAQFQQDDTACRVAAVALPPAPGSAPAVAAPADPTAVPQQMPPGAIYLRCMASRDNVIEPLAPARPVLYGYYSDYPIYAGFGDTYPWLYGDYYGFGFYGGFGGGYGRYGFRNYGFRDYGFRGGEGGFRGGEGGFRGGEGGFRGGGFGGGRGEFRR